MMKNLLLETSETVKEISPSGMKQIGQNFSVPKLGQFVCVGTSYGCESNVLHDGEIRPIPT